jgi:hypothetical protein
VCKKLLHTKSQKQGKNVESFCRHRGRHAGELAAVTPTPRSRDGVARCRERAPSSSQRPVWISGGELAARESVIALSGFPGGARPRGARPPLLAAGITPPSAVYQASPRAEEEERWRGRWDGSAVRCYGKLMIRLERGVYSGIDRHVANDRSPTNSTLRFVGSVCLNSCLVPLNTI